MSRERRRLMILVGLLCVTLLVAVVRFWPQTAASIAARADPKAAARGKGPSAITAPDVHLDALADGKPKPGSAPQRDLFRFKPKPPPPAAAPPVASAPAVSAPSGPPPPPPLPPIAMRFIGLVESPAQGQKIAILSDGRGATRDRKAISSRAVIGFCALASSRWRWRISTAAAVRRSGSRDHSDAAFDFTHHARTHHAFILTQDPSRARPWPDRRLQIAHRPVRRFGGHVTTRLKQLAAIACAIAFAAGCAASEAFRKGNAAMKAGDLDQAVAYYRTAVAGRSRQPELQDRARARACWRRRARTSTGRSSSKSRISSKRRAASTGSPANTTRATVRPAQGGGARSDDPRADRSARAEAADRAAARARARRGGRAAAESGLARAAAASASPTPTSATSSNAHRQRHRHQHHLRPRRAATAASRCSSTA